MTTHQVNAVRYDAGSATHVSEQLAVEDVLQININGEPFSVTMRTPGDDEALVRGLLYTEDVVPAHGTEYRYDETVDPRTGRVLRADISIDPQALNADVAKGRSLMATASCGICGRKEMRDLGLGGEPLRPSAMLDVRWLPEWQAKMQAAQATFTRSGGSHAAAFFSLDGQCLAVNEDIGRHNAVDKVVGAVIMQRALDVAECLLVSGRVSYEIVLKAYKAGAPFIVAVSAPSSLSARASDELGITLIGFCRETRATVYSHAECVGPEEVSP